MKAVEKEAMLVVSRRSLGGEVHAGVNNPAACRLTPAS